MNTGEPVLLIWGAVVALLGVLELTGVIDATTKANIIAAVVSGAGAITARAKVTPVAPRVRRVPRA